MFKNLLVDILRTHVDFFWRKIAFQQTEIVFEKARTTNSVRKTFPVFLLTLLNQFEFEKTQVSSCTREL